MSNMSTARETINKAERLPEIADRLRRMNLENRDWRYIVKAYSHRNTVIFADPPYDLAARRSKAYGHEMTDMDHVDLAFALKESPSAAMVAGYRSELYDELYKDWRREERQYRCHQSASKSNAKAVSIRTECLWIKDIRTPAASLLGDAP